MFTDQTILEYREAGAHVSMTIYKMEVNKAPSEKIKKLRNILHDIREDREKLITNKRIQYLQNSPESISDLLSKLKERKDELNRKRVALEDSGISKAINHDLFLVREELIDIRRHIKALTIDHKAEHKRMSNAPDFEIARQEYLDWYRKDNNFNENIADARENMKSAAIKGMDTITKRQKQIMELRASNKSIKEIAKMLGIDRSTVSRTLKRAKRNLKNDIEQNKIKNSILLDSDDEGVVDLRKPIVIKTILSRISPKQCTYLFLYYTERLNTIAIEKEFRKNRSTVTREIQKCFLTLNYLFDDKSVVIEHLEVLDILGYDAYCRLKEDPSILSDSIRPSNRRNKDSEHYSLKDHVIKIEKCRSTEGHKLLNAVKEYANGSEVIDTLALCFDLVIQELKKR